MRRDLGIHWNDIKLDRLLNAAYDGVEVLEHKRRIRNMRARAMMEQAGLRVVVEDGERRMAGALGAEFLPDETGQLLLMVSVTAEDFPGSGSETYYGLPGPLAEAVRDGALAVPEVEELGAGVLLFDRAEVHPTLSSPALFEWLAGSVVRLLTADVGRDEAATARLLRVGHPEVAAHEIESRPDVEAVDVHHMRQGDVASALEWVQQEEAQAAIDVENLVNEFRAVDAPDDYAGQDIEERLANLDSALGTAYPEDDGDTRPLVDAADDDDTASWSGSGDAERAAEAPEPAPEADPALSPNDIETIVWHQEHEKVEPDIVAPYIDVDSDLEPAPSSPEATNGQRPPVDFDPEDVAATDTEMRESDHMTLPVEVIQDVMMAFGADESADVSFRAEPPADGDLALPDEDESVPVLVDEFDDVGALADDLMSLVEHELGDDITHHDNEEPQLSDPEDPQATRIFKIETVDEVLERLGLSQWSKLQDAEDAEGQPAHRPFVLDMREADEEPEGFGQIAGIDETEAEIKSKDIVRAMSALRGEDDAPSEAPAEAAVEASPALEEAAVAEEPDGLAEPQWVETYEDIVAEEPEERAEPTANDMPVMEEPAFGEAEAFGEEEAEVVAEEAAEEGAAAATDVRVDSDDVYGEFFPLREETVMARFSSMGLDRDKAEESPKARPVKADDPTPMPPPPPDREPDPRLITGQFRKEEVLAQLSKGRQDVLEAEPLDPNERKVLRIKLGYEKESTPMPAPPAVDDRPTPAPETVTPEPPPPGPRKVWRNDLPTPPVGGSEPVVVMGEDPTEPPMTPQMIKDLQRIQNRVKTEETAVFATRGGQDIPLGSGGDPFGYPPPMKAKRTPFGDLVFYQCAACGEYGAMKVAIHTYRCYRCEAVIEYKPIRIE